MNDRIKEITDKYIEDIKASDEYMAFHQQSEMIKMIPDLQNRINAYRAENFELQNKYEGDELFDKLEEFQQRNEAFLEDPKVDSFLQAEAGFVRMMQQIADYIMEGLQFQ